MTMMRKVIMMVTDRIRTYTELIQLPTFQERFDYLNLNGIIGEDTFGNYSRRWMNQTFYRSKEWERIKNYVISRDGGCDMALPQYQIPDSVKLVVHHMNPIDEEDIQYRTEFLTDPEYLICVSFETHNAIHFGDINVARISKDPVVRRPNDQCPWLSSYQAVPYVTARGFNNRQGR